jgi:hypothetical protein
MICDDRPEFPATAVMELDVSGPIDVVRLKQAWEETMPRHPLLAAQVEQRRFRLPQWRIGSKPPRFDVASLGTPLDGVSQEPFDLEHEAGTRVFVRASDHQATLTLQVHHACSDAVGKLAVFADWLSRYAALGGDARFDQLPDPHLERLPQRGMPRYPTRQKPTKRSWGPALKQWAKFFNCRPATLAGKPPGPEERDVPSPAFCTEEFAAAEFSQVRAAAKQSGLTLNDFLLTAMFRTLGEWSRREGESGDPLFRLMVPFNMRLAEELNDSASNRIGYRFLAQRRSETDNWRESSRSVREPMEFTRTQRMSDFTRFLNLLGSCSPLAVLLRRKARREDTVFATAVLSNFGDAARMYPGRFPVEDGRWRIGELSVDAIRACPPKRPNTNLCVVAHGYGNSLHLVARCDGRGLAAESIRDFMSLYRQTILRLTEEIVAGAPQRSLAAAMD